MASESSLRARAAGRGTSPLPAARVVRVTLPDGQRAKLLIPSGLVSATSVQRLARQATRNLERRAQGLEEWARKLVADHEKLTRAQSKGLRRSLSRISLGDFALDQRVVRLQRDGEKEWSALEADTRDRARRARAKALVYPALLLSSLPLFSIYGRRNLEHNLTLTIALAIWVLGDDLTDLLSSQQSAEYNAQRSEWWLYVAPALNLLAGWWLLHERQHEPLISGVATKLERAPSPPGVRDDVRSVRRALGRARAVLAPCLGEPTEDARYHEEYRAVVELAPHVAKDFELDLLGLSEPPVLLTLASLRWARGSRRVQPRVESLSGRVELGNLYISLRVSAARRPPREDVLVEDARVAWVVQVLNETSLGRLV
jgi:hypothetical protein